MRDREDDVRIDALKLRQNSCLYIYTRQLPVSKFVLERDNLCKNIVCARRQVADTAGAYPSFCSIKQLGVFLLPPPRGWDASP